MQRIPSELQGVEEVALATGVRSDKYVEIAQRDVTRPDAAEVVEPDALDWRGQSNPLPRPAPRSRCKPYRRVTSETRIPARTVSGGGGVRLCTGVSVAR